MTRIPTATRRQHVRFARHRQGQNSQVCTRWPDLTVDKLLDQIFTQDIARGNQLNTKMDKTDVGMVPVLLMTAKAEGTRIYGLADGQAHLLRVEGPKGQLGALDFTQRDALAPVSARPAN
jgi:hypothetical protein